MIEIVLKCDKKVIIETLSRMGILNRKEKILYPSSYLYEDNGRFFIAHFKELFKITRDNAYVNICDEDILRLKAIVWNLRNWGLVDANEEDIEPHNKYIHVINFKDKHQYQISHKFNIKNLYLDKKDE